MIGNLNPNIQINTFIKRFMKLNPLSDNHEIDWETTIDKNARFDENLENLKNEYPQYEWEEKKDPYYFQGVDSLREQARDYGMEVIDKGLVNRITEKNGRLEVENAKLTRELRTKKLYERKKPKSETVDSFTVSDSETFIDKIVDDVHDVNIVLNAINKHGKSSSLRTIVARLKERYPNTIIKIFDISQAWYHNAPVKHRQRITLEKMIKSQWLNVNDCVYEIGSLGKEERKIFVSWIVDQDHRSRYDMGIKYGIESVKQLPFVVYIFEEATNYFSSMSLKGSSDASRILYDFITVGRNYGLRSFLVVTREQGSLSTDIRDISPKILGYVESNSDLAYYKRKSKALGHLVKTMPQYHWVYYYRSHYGPFRIKDTVNHEPKDFVIKNKTVELSEQQVKKPLSWQTYIIIVLLALLAVALIFK